MPEIPREILDRLARMLGLPDKAWATEINSRWSRVHTPLTIDNFVRRLTGGLPLASSVSSFDGKYTHLQNFITFDVDCKTDIPAAARNALTVGHILEERGVASGMTYTGKKGFRVWVWLNTPLPDNAVAKFQHNILTVAGFVKTGEGKYKRDNVDCETLVRSGDGGIVKIPFSRHQDNDRAAYFELPVDAEMIANKIYERSPTDDDWFASFMLFDGWTQINTELVAAQVDWEDTGVAPTVPHRFVQAPPFTIAPYTPDLAEIYDIRPPCIDYAIKHSVGAYEIRIPIAHWLSARGVPIEKAAAFFQKFVCDAEDLLHPEELIKQLRYYYPSKNLCRCNTYNMPGRTLFCCPGPCGRKNPTVMEPPHKISVPPVTPLLTTETAQRFFDGVIIDGANTSILGPARSGKTTGVGLAIIKGGHSATILTPRISIITDTWVKVLQLAKERKWETYACVVPDNRESCIKLKKIIAAVRQEQGLVDGEKSAAENAPYMDKLNCTKCKYRNAVPKKIEPYIIYGESDVMKGFCGYQTIVQNDSLWNLIILTNKKFNRIVSLKQDDDFEAPIYKMITSRGRYVLDEVSSYFETPESDITIFTKTLPANEKYFFLDKLKEDVVKVQRYIEAKIDNTPFEVGGRRAKLTRRLTSFNEIYEDVKKDIADNYIVVMENPETNVFVLKRTIDIEEIESMRAALRLAQGVAEKKALMDNELLEYIYDLITLGTELEWIFTNDPNYEFETRVNIKIAPKTIGYLNAIKNSQSQIIALDVQPPIIKLDRFFGMRFEHFNIGDRGHIYDKYIIIPDSRRIRASDMYKEDNQLRLLNFADRVAKIFGDSNTDVLFPTIRCEDQIISVLKSRYPNITSRHHRGSLTMGVHCDRRVAVSVCRPFSPKKSLYWLKAGPYQELLKDVSHHQLWLHQQAKETMQGEARYIDPEGMVNSVVFAFGMNEEDVRENYINALVPPRILSTLRGREDEDRTVALAQGYIWRKRGIAIEKSEDLLAIRAILEGVGNAGVVNRHRLSWERVSELRSLLEGLV